MQDAIPIQSIQGTSLKTGLFYVIELADYKSEDGGIMSISLKAFDGTKDRYYVKVDKSNDYKVGGQFYALAQWMFIPSEVDGYYEIANRHFPTHMICIGNKSFSGNFVIALEDGATNKAKLADYGKDGAKRDEALWKLVKRKNDFYSIELLKFKSNNGGQMNPVRDKEIEGGASNPLQVYGPDRGPNGPKKAQFRLDEMFAFETAMTTTINGNIIQMNTSKLGFDDLRDMSKVSVVIFYC